MPTLRIYEPIEPMESRHPRAVPYLIMNEAEQPDQPEAANPKSSGDHWGSLASELGAPASERAAKDEPIVAAKLPGVAPTQSKSKPAEPKKGGWGALASMFGIASTSTEKATAKEILAEDPPIIESSQPDSPTVAGEADDETLAEIAAREAELAELDDVDFLEDESSNDSDENGEDAITLRAEPVDSEDTSDETSDDGSESDEDSSEKPRRRRRRGRRRRGRGRSSEKSTDEKEADEATTETVDSSELSTGDSEESSTEDAASEESADKPPRRRRRRRGRGRKGASDRSASDRESKESETKAEDEDDREESFALAVGYRDTIDDDADLQEISESDDDSDGESSGPTVHRNIPTWLDAVGGIVDRNLEQRSKGGRGSGNQGGGSGGRRGSGRRGGGRRPRGRGGASGSSS